MAPQTEHDTPESQPQKQVRTPSTRWAALLAAAMLGIGIAVGAAIGPAPQSSLGAAAGLAQRLPLLIAGIDSHRGSAAAASTTPEEAPAAVEATVTKRRKRKAKPGSSTPAAESTESSSEESSSGDETKKQTKKLPTVKNVWLIELAGGSFEAALAQASAAPYIDGQLLPQATLLKGWSALDGSAFASEAAIAEAPVAGSTPPLLHSIVQPPCPEGAAGASCAAETPGQLTAADEFLKATVATITGTSTYKEGGLIVITFATVGIATQSELPAGASTATLTYQPPAGVALLSPLTKAGQRSSVAFNPTSPRQSLEKLLH
jgi:hypothetical protein